MGIGEVNSNVHESPRSTPSAMAALLFLGCGFKVSGFLFLKFFPDVRLVVSMLTVLPGFVGLFVCVCVCVSVCLCVCCSKDLAACGGAVA